MQWNEAAGRLLGIEPENLMGRIFADLRPEPRVIAAAAAARGAGVKVAIPSNGAGLRYPPRRGPRPHGRRRGGPARYSAERQGPGPEPHMRRHP
ncbi:PAS domain-containing protein [Streptomyces sp. NPDC057521]|uniref:PAS domain-containing protein n=1 Tax=Streptomyces sp. NPDC057521 TaxID=3346156 RepID=UPI0036853F2B